MPLLKNLWQRVKDSFARLFPRKPPQPGHFVADTKLAWRGFLAAMPWLAPQRGYLVYVPAGLTDRWTFRRHPLLVLIHGCRQTPEDIAAGTRITHLADQNRFLVLLPRQHPRANSWGCWNWFDRATSRGWGETAIVAAQIRAVRRAYRINKKRVFVAGMSSGWCACCGARCSPARSGCGRVHSLGDRLWRGVIPLRRTGRIEKRRRYRCARHRPPRPG
jgi:hypothetical protein